MKNNVIALPVGRIRRDTAVNRRKQYMDQDLYVRMVMNDPGLMNECHTVMGHRGP